MISRVTMAFAFAAALAGCAGQGQYNPNYVPLPTGDQLRAQQPQPYIMQVPQQQYQKPLNCTTRYVGATAYTNCF